MQEYKDDYGFNWLARHTGRVISPKGAQQAEWKMIASAGRVCDDNGKPVSSFLFAVNGGSQHCVIIFAELFHYSSNFIRLDTQ